MLGTVAYMSPEQVRAEPMDVRTDLFSFGVVLYEMATGTLPFVGDSSAVRAPFSTTVAGEVARIIDKCLEKDRDLRYQQASDIRTDLQRLKRDTDSGRVTSSGSRRAVATRWKMIVAGRRGDAGRSRRRPTCIFTARQHSPTRTRLSSRISRTRPATRYLTTRCARDCPWSFNNLRSSA